MNALMIYQDFASAAKASAALQHLAHQYAADGLDLRVQWKILPWRLDMLKFPPTAAEALAEAADAHLIVFIGRSAQSIPGWLLQWLDQWAVRRHVADAALAVMGDANTGALPAAAIPELFQFARHHGLSVIFDDCGAIDTGAAAAREPISKSMTAITPFIPPTAGQRERG
jgi:hypothetical protein